MKGLLFGGCSFTWGQGLYFYSDLPNLYNPKNIHEFLSHKVTKAQIKYKNTLYFPRLVANHFNTFEVVKEKNGGSEDETFEFFKTIFDNKNNIVSRNDNYTYDDFDYIILQLSSVVRNKFYFKINNVEFSTPGWFPNNEILRYMELSNLTLDDCYNELLVQQFERLKRELIFYENQGLKIKILLWFEDLLEFIKKDDFFNDKIVKFEYDNKVFKTIYELGESYDEMYIYTDPYFKDKKFNDYHPSRLLHKVIADGIIKSIES